MTKRRKSQDPTNDNPVKDWEDFAKVQDVTVTMRTEVRADGVLYSVIFNGETLGRKFVPFGPDAGHRAGGYEFAAAARQQEAWAGALMSGRKPFKLLTWDD